MARASETTSSTTSDRPNGRSTRRSDREAEILGAAVEIFFENGYADTAVEDVANAVGILKGSLYYYIDSKEDLLFRIVTQVEDELQELAEGIVAARDQPPLARLAELVRALVDYNARNLRRVAVYYHDYARLGEARLADIRRRRRTYERIVGSLLDEAARRGDIPARLDRRLATRAVLATVVSMYTWYRGGAGASAAALADFTADFVVSGVRGGPGAAPRARAAAPSRAAAPRAAAPRAARRAPARRPATRRAAARRPAAARSTTRPAARAPTRARRSTRSSRRSS